MKYTQKSVRALAATLITFGSLAAGIIGFTGNASAATYVEFDAIWSGASYGNTGLITGTFKLDLDVITTLGDHTEINGSLPSWIKDVKLTVSGTPAPDAGNDFTTNNGIYTDIDFTGARFTTNQGVPDLTAELRGQSFFADFILWDGGSFPSAAGPFIQYSNAGLVVLTSLKASTSTSTSAVPEPSSQLALIALGSAGLLTRRRIKRKA
ncbi:PEP-CTERM sorting domain-containing protein [bacterium]|nr:PEP-CTERM sorting domain-containing protein [bacterium]